MNGSLIPSLITISPDSGARHIALTRQTRQAERSLHAAGWRCSKSLWFAPRGLPSVYCPPQMPLGLPMRGFFVTCLHGDAEYTLFGASERGARIFLEQVLNWQPRGERWECPHHPAQGE